MKTVDGRDAITRKEWCERISIGHAEARRLYTERERTKHPEPAFSIGRTAYWWLDDMETWWERYNGARSPKPIERVGDPDELLYAQDVAQLLGYSNYRTVLTMHQRDQFAPPDATAPVGRGGNARPQWKRSTVWDWADKRRWVHQ